MTCFYGHPRGHVNARACIAPCITQVTFKLVHYALLIYQLRFVFTFLKVPTENTGWIVVWSLMLRSFNCVLTRVLVLEGYDYSGHVISRHFFRSLQWLLVRNSRVYEGINGIKPTNTDTILSLLILILILSLLILVYLSTTRVTLTTGTNGAY